MTGNIIKIIIIIVVYREIQSWARKFASFIVTLLPEQNFKVNQKRC